MKEGGIRNYEQKEGLDFEFDTHACSVDDLRPVRDGNCRGSCKKDHDYPKESDDYTG